jgi:hypothetical protein
VRTIRRPPKDIPRRSQVDATARERPYSAPARYYDRVYASKDYAKETRETLRFARTGRPPDPVGS